MMTSLKMKIGALVLCTVFSISTLIVLSSISEDEKMKKNGFNRRVRFSAELRSLVDLKVEGHYFAGVSNEKVYLANSKEPSFILEGNYFLTDSTRRGVRYDKAFWPVLSTARIQIDSPNIYLADGITPRIVKGEIESLDLNRALDTVPYFISAMNISQNHMILKIYSAKLNQALLFKYSKSGNNDNSPYYILERQIDGTFCTQGTLSYDAKRNHIIYTFLYRNQFVSLDSSMTVVFKANTIDTNSVAKLKISKVDSNRYSLASPPSTVNDYSYADGDNLFVQSHLLGDAEDYRDFSKFAPIDVYSLTNGTYRGSFYLPMFVNREKLHTFVVKGKYLLALYKHYYAAYDINME